MDDIEKTAIRFTVDGAVARITLARPDERNALGPGVAAEIIAAAQTIGADSAIRVVVLAADGKHFSAGADLRWMRASLNLSVEDNVSDAQSFAQMFAELNNLPQALICCVEGAAIGGGAGLVAVADIVIAAENAIFGFTETRLGIIPAMIGPYVVAKIGYSAARAAFVRANRFDAATAQRIGLVHEVVPADALRATCDARINELLENAPGAIADAKRFLREITVTDVNADAQSLQSREAGFALHAARTIAERRHTAEAQAGIRAFLERGRAPWVRE